jgi:hypothetical protein
VGEYYSALHQWGRFLIFDSRVRRAMSRLLDSRVPNTIRWYLDFYCPLFCELAKKCGANNLRLLDMALFCYGKRNRIAHPISVPSNASLTEPTGPDSRHCPRTGSNICIRYGTAVCVEKVFKI